MSVAQTILSQLGGNKFLAMTGARNLLDGGKYLQFDLPRGAAKNKATKVRITLAADDTYKLDFFRYANYECKPVAGGAYGLYADQLREVFEIKTGLYTSL